MPSISVRKLYQDNQAKLSLAWSAGTAGADNRISVDADKPVLALVGHLNFIHPNQVQVLGVAEVAYLDKMGRRGSEGEPGRTLRFEHCPGDCGQRFAGAFHAARLLPHP